MGDVTIRLNRFGFEQGRMWQVVLAAAAIVLPMAVWIGLERLSGDTSEELEPGVAIALESYPVSGASLQLLPPGKGWRSDLSLQQNRISLHRGNISLSAQVDTDVEDLRRLLERRADHLTSSQSSVTAANVRPYANPVGDDGYRADLYGRDVVGTIVVIGNERGAAATLVYMAPSGQLDEGYADVDRVVASFVLSGS